MADFNESRGGSLLTAGWLTIIRVAKYLANHTTQTLSFAGTAVARTGANLLSWSGAGIHAVNGAVTRLLGIARTKAGAITLSATYTRLAAFARTYSGAISTAGSYIRKFLQWRTHAGALTSSGTYTRLINVWRTKAGALTFAGNYLRTINNLAKRQLANQNFYGVVVAFIGQKTANGFLIVSGSISRLIGNITRQCVGVFAPTGTVRRLLSNLTRTYSGSLSFSGILTYLQGFFTATGVLTFAGNVFNTAQRVRKILTSGRITIIRVLKYLPNHISQTLSFVGNLTYVRGSSAGYDTFRDGYLYLTRVISRIFDITRTVTGAITFAGSSLGQKFGGAFWSNTVAGAISFAGAITDVLITNVYEFIHNVHISFSGVVSYVNPLKFRTKTGTLTFWKELSYDLGGYVRTQYYRTYTGVLNFTGSVTKLFGPSRLKSGLQSFSGIISHSIGAAQRTYSGAVSFSKTLSYIYRAAASILEWDVSKAGILTLAGRLIRLWESKMNDTGAIAFKGKTYGDKLTDALYYGTPYGGPSYP